MDPYELTLKLGQKTMAVIETGKNRIMIYGPKDDGTYLVEFKTAAGEALTSYAGDWVTRSIRRRGEPAFR
jgi:hypothetical protein